MFDNGREQQARYRAGVIGLGWMGMLSDLGARPPDRYEIEDVNRPTPELDVHRRFHFHQGSGAADVPHSWAEVMWQRPEVELVAAAERDVHRLGIFRERYGIDAVYEDAEEMLRREGLDIVAIATNTAGRADLTCLAVEAGVKAIAVEKPMAHTLTDADRMVAACSAAGVPLLSGAIPINHPAYGRAKDLLTDGAIGDLLSIEADGPKSQKPHWAYFVDGHPHWVAGGGDGERRETGSNEFNGQGVMVTRDGLFVFFRDGCGLVRLTGSSGELALDSGFRLWQDVQTARAPARVEVPWPEPQLAGDYNAVFGLADLIDCLQGRLDEPKSSGRRTAVAMEVEIALKVSSAQGGARVELPLADRSLGLHYDWFR